MNNKKNTFSEYPDVLTVQQLAAMLRISTKSFSTGLKIRGNARKADRMLQQLRQEFKAPDMHPDYGKVIRSNPADLIDKPSKDSFESSVYSKDELRELFMAFVGDPLELAVMLASFYGLRRSEIVGLKWRAIDFVRKTITVQHVVTQATVDGEYKLVKKNRTKTKASNRSLPLVPQFEQALRKLLERQQLNRKVFGNAYSTEYLDYILVNELGELMKPGFITQHFGLVRDKNNLKFIRFHDLRYPNQNKIQTFMVKAVCTLFFLSIKVWILFLLLRFSKSAEFN